MKWNYGTCKIEAAKYKTKNEFRKGNSRAYIVSLNNKWLEEFGFVDLHKSWNYEACKIEALKYKTRHEFQQACSRGYQLARINNWLDEICAHMFVLQETFTKSECIEIAKRYKKRNDFRLSLDHKAYNYAQRHGWLDEICAHMKRQNNQLYKTKDYWTKEKCKIEATKYKYRNEYRKQSSLSYSTARINNWLDEVCLHMIPQGNLTRRCIYVYEFPNNVAYVGLTFNILNRHKEHLVRGPVFEYFNLTGISIPQPKQLTNYEDLNIAVKNEVKFFNVYKENGWILLNKKLCGGAGMIQKWTKEKCKIEADKYKTKKEFYSKNRKVYYAASKYGWLNEICSHMKTLKKDQKNFVYKKL